MILVNTFQFFFLLLLFLRRASLIPSRVVYRVYVYADFRVIEPHVAITVRLRLSERFGNTCTKCPRHARAEHPEHNAYRPSQCVRLHNVAGSDTHAETVFVLLAPGTAPGLPAFARRSSPTSFEIIFSPYLLNESGPGGWEPGRGHQTSRGPVRRPVAACRKLSR